MVTVAPRSRPVAGSAGLRLGSALMALAGLAFIGHAVIFFVRNFTRRLPRARHRTRPGGR